MNHHRQSAVFSGLSEKYFVRDEASWRSSSPSMPKLSPGKPRSADELTPGELRTDREEGRCSPRYDRTGSSDMQRRADLNDPAVREVTPGSRYEARSPLGQLAVENHPSINSPQQTRSRMSFTNGAQRPGRNEVNYDYGVEGSFGHQRHTEKRAMYTRNPKYYITDGDDDGEETDFRHSATRRGFDGKQAVRGTHMDSQYLPYESEYGTADEFSESNFQRVQPVNRDREEVGRYKFRRNYSRSPAQQQMHYRGRGTENDTDCRENYRNDDFYPYERPRRRRAEQYLTSRKHYSDSDSSDVEERATMIQRRFIKPAKFDGSSSFETFMAQFNNCADYNNWKSADRLAQLKACLTGEAGQVLWDSSPEATNTLSKLIEMLKNRFGGSRLADKYRMELRLRRRRSGETLSALHCDVRRLMALAHPDLPHKARESIACDYFIDSLNDADFALKVRERNPGTLDEALRIALQLEAWHQDADRLRLEEAGRQRSRQVRGVAAEEQKPAETFVRQSDLQDRMNRMEAGLHQYLNEILQSCRLSNQLNHQTANITPSSQTALQSNNDLVSNSKDLKRGGMKSNGCWRCGDPNHHKRDCTTSMGSRSNSEKLSPPRSAMIESGSNMNSAATRLAVGLDNADVYVRMELNGKQIPCLVDSGCEITLVPSMIVDSSQSIQLRSTSQRIFAANGSEIEVSGEVLLPFILNGRQIDTPALVSPDVAEVMLGVDWLKQHKCIWDFGHSRLTVDGHTVMPLSVKRSTQCRRVYAVSDVIIQPRQQVDVAARATITSARRVKSDWALESHQVQSGIYAARTVLPSEHHGLHVRLINTKLEPQIVKNGTFLGAMSPVEVLEATETRQKDDNAVNDEVLKVVNELLSHIPAEINVCQREQIRVLLEKNADILSLNEYDVGRTTLVQQTINTGDHQPIRQSLRRHPIAHLEAIDQQVEEMRQHGIIEPAASPWASNVVLVRKKDGSLRFCVDYRALNSITYKDTYPLPHIDLCLDSLSGSTWFTTLDLRSGYHNIPISQEDKDKTAFITRRGCWRYNVMPFGLTCAPSVFQRLMDLVLCGLTFEVCMVFLDDIIVFASNFDEHLSRLEQVFQRLRSANLKVKPSKCKLFQKRVEFLGHVVSAAGIEMQPDKVLAVRTWPVPKNLHELRSFIGLCSYYRKFIAGFADVAAPLNSLMAKNKPFIWTEQQNEAFDQLKERLTTAPILAMPRDGGLFYLDTDASDCGLGAVLSQIQDNSERVIAYASRTLNNAEKNYCVTRKELLAVVYGLKQFRQFLLGRHFIIRTDHSALQWLQKTPEPIAQQARWLAYIEQFDYAIEHRPGVRHGNADALSRRPQSCRNCSACRNNYDLNETQMKSEEAVPQLARCSLVVSVDTNSGEHRENSMEESSEEVLQQQGTSDAGQPIRQLRLPDSLCAQDVDYIAKAQQEDLEFGCIVKWRLKQETAPSINELLAESEECKILLSQWHRLLVKDGLVYRTTDSRGNKLMQLLIPKCLRQSVLQQCHTGMCGGHLGTNKTMEQVKRRAFWFGWRGDVRRFCRRCTNCKSYHRGKLPRSAALQPIITGAPFERLSVDLTGPHTRSFRGSVYILTCIDPFTKWVEAFPLPNKEASTVAKILVEQVFCRFGVPIALLTDRGKEVDGRIMNEVCKLMEIDKMRTTSYKPSTNAAIERFHRTLNSMLGRVVSENQKNWDSWLPYIMAAYRSSQNEATSYSPNYLMLGREVRAPIDIVLGTSVDDAQYANYDDFVDELRRRLCSAYEVVRRQLGKTAERNKHYYDLRVKPAAYKVGDLVYYFNPRRYRGLQEKWQRKFTGPFRVLKVLGPVNILIQRSPRARPFAVHIDKVKLAESDNERGEGIQQNSVSSHVSLKDSDRCDIVQTDVLGNQQYDQYGVGPVLDQRPRRTTRRPKRFED